MLLDRFAAAKEPEINALKVLDAAGDMPAPLSCVRPSFSGALQSKGPGAVIAEYKRASPSKGVINTELGPEEVTAAYRNAGAAALSVLTEEDHFAGSLDYLKPAAATGLPVLRKDFILHPLQIRVTAATKASALLLIARMVDTAEQLASMIVLTEELGMEAVVEIFDQADLDKARTAGATIIQVNNRDLDTLAIDLNTSFQFIEQKKDGEIWIAASGITTPAQARRMREAGFDGLLMGTVLMQDGTPEKTLRTFTAGTDNHG
jgi:indole-3-glycerol phosphate synthase